VNRKIHTIYCGNYTVFSVEERAKVLDIYKHFSVVHEAPLQFQFRIDGIAKTIAEEVEAKNRHEDSQTRVNNEARIGPDKLLRVLKHVSPAGKRRLDTESEEADGCFVDD
jgi:hypothetical protein